MRVTVLITYNHRNEEVTHNNIGGVESDGTFLYLEEEYSPQSHAYHLDRVVKFTRSGEESG